MTTVDQLQASLPAVLRPVLGADVAIENLRVLTGGASRSTWAFDAVTPSGRRSLILRTGAPDDMHAGMEREARVQAAAEAAGAPVPHILVATDSVAPLGNPFLICDEIKGETIVRRIDRQLERAGGAAVRARLLRQCAQALAAIHRADPSGVELDTQDQLAEWRARLDAMGDTTATFEWAFRWLGARRPPPSAARLVHGDFRMGNLIVDGSELAAVLDWELVHIGEVYEDLAWFCVRAWRFGAPASRGAGGLGSVESFLSAYEEASGTMVDRKWFNWWLILATLRWGIICRYQAHRHLSGQVRSVELATIGRRVCETEWDLLELLDPGNAVRDIATTGSGQADRHRTALYGRPTAPELVAAVAEFLETDVRQATSGRVNFHARVAANALRMVERELLAAEDRAARTALARLGFTDEAELAAAIRGGDLDQRAADVTSCLRTLVKHRLAVVHPGYEESDDNG
ncbi:phosphotransferase family protein [Mycobacterium xenopi]|uniref:Aminoglycoside phosphotransferase n=2 Tax=Mycobacterium xenopi TaxID=1789 RepID=A0AAD1H2Y9_MYCXE|nr:phosphotransferase family protein [Mycobacterium xenopi]MDA3641466.1 phosphotransferase [Mycobacterium xenopi]MDA3659662.1 phosphotransferase [Mycobacterium xenopi]MDA3664635.1 phosphotransferase [Mycobacterium xenopi]ORX21842.1 aminoglycoside phosphotransferase [Mycobacterium xenopi]SPX89394.1 aminoglycoside phospho transferase [Mycobacterium xenopi]